MKRTLLSLLLVLCMVFSLVACSIPGATVTPCQHRDKDDDNLCDKCDEPYTDGKDIITPCQHRDIDDNSRCDKCDANYTDGKDVFVPCQHRDADDNGKCDKCNESYSDGKDIPDAPVCQHRDANDDGECDECGVAYTDGKDIPDTPVCQHRDADDNGECDNCGEAYEDGKDIPDAPVCQHRDADDDDECDKCREDYADGTDLECAHSFSDWALYGDNTSAPCDQKPLYRVCSDCGEIEWKDGGYDNHSFQTVMYKPTCQAQGYDEKTCTVCGFVDKVNYTPIADHDYKAAYTTYASFHWLECKNCDAIGSYAEHTVDDSGFCTTCDAPLSPTEGIIYDVSADGTYAEVIAYNGTATKILIADTYNGLPVKNIYKEAFRNNDSIVSVAIPDSVTSIGDSAFAGCISLTSVVIPDSVETLGAYAFAYCDQLSEITLGESLVSIGDSAFSSCNSLTSVVIPDSVETLGGCAFYYCDQLSEITLGESLVSIGYWAFQYCDSLTSVVIPDSVTTIGERAFSWCYDLTSVTILGAPEVGAEAFSYCNSALYTEYNYGTYVGNEENPYAILIGLTNRNLNAYTIHEDTIVIADSVFYNCGRLTSIIIPVSVKVISFSPFYNFGSLTNIKYRGTQEQWNAITKGSYWDHYYNCDYGEYKPLNYTITYNYTGE